MISHNKNSLYWISTFFILIEHGIINLLENSINIGWICVWIAIMTLWLIMFLKIIKILEIIFTKIKKKASKENTADSSIYMINVII